MIDKSQANKPALKHRHAFIPPGPPSTRVDFVAGSTFGGEQDDVVIGASKGNCNEQTSS
jgi:hypothetical protein